MKLQNTTLKRGLMGLLVGASCLLVNPAIVRADDDPIAAEETAAEETANTKQAEWTAAVKEKYQLTDEQIKAMEDKGMHGPQLAIVAGLAKSSGKTIDEVMAMRTDQHMGWGKIAKELGVHPGQIGQSVAELHRGVKEDRRDKRMEARKDRKQDRRDGRKEKRNDRKQDRAENREKRAKG